MTSSYFVDDIIIIKWAGLDIYNEPNATTEYEVKGKIEYKTKLLSGLSGQGVVAGTKNAVTASATVLLGEEIDDIIGGALQHEDRIKFNNIEHTILKIDRPKAFTGYFVFKYEVWVA